MPSLVVLGAGGFLGRALIAQERHPMPVRAVVRSKSSIQVDSHPGVSWVEADLFSRGWERHVLEADDVVVNLAYVASGGTAANLRLIDAIIEGCRSRRVARLVHCSTAVVVGASRSREVSETTVCEPVTPYERTKWLVEQHVLTGAGEGLDMGIARPTAIVGPSGRNLESLALSLQLRPALINYLRACLFGRRPLHLVPVNYVAEALVHLAARAVPLEGNIFLIAADDDPDNNFPAVEELLREILGIPRLSTPLIPLPQALLAFILRLRGRSASRLDRFYTSEKLRASGFPRTDSVASAVRAFGESLARGQKL